MTTEPKIYPCSQPDRLALVVRGVCGVLLGLALAAYVWVRSGGFGFWPSAALFVAAVVVCTWGSIRHGDAFWLSVLIRR
jgi:alpha-D-ribose 1-methylphosphonate 5-triphosphate synthase subunit PhnI